MPALMSFAQDLGHTCLTLGVEGVEGLFKAFFRGLSSIDGAANPSGHDFLTPKKSGPDH